MKLVMKAILLVVALMLPVSAFAMSAESCEEFKGGTPGLYGLCIAFQKDTECVVDMTLEDPFQNCRNSSKKLLALFEERAQPGDPTMPGVNYEPDPGSGAACPCFNAQTLEDNIWNYPTPFYSSYYEPTPLNDILAIMLTDFVINSENPSWQARVQLETQSDNPDSEFTCVYAPPPVMFNNPDSIYLQIDQSEYQACRDILEQAIEANGLIEHTGG